ncbi:MAG: hypothetical protein ACT4PL_10265 [Phycisphaerales bacterium]
MLRLVDDRENHETLHLERRRVPRNPCESTVTAYFTTDPTRPAPAAMGESLETSAEHDGGTPRFGVLTLTVTDFSPAGIGCASSRAIELGARVSICPAGIPAAYKAGTVVSCRPAEQGFQIGLRFDYRAAAAVRGA